MPEADALVLARLAGYCTGILKTEGHMTTEQAMEGMVHSMLSSPLAGGMRLTYDLDATRCLKLAAVAAEKAAVAHNRQVEARHRREATVAHQEAAERRKKEHRASAGERGLRYVPKTRKYERAFSVFCEVCHEPTANGKQGRPPKVHPACKGTRKAA